MRRKGFIKAAMSEELENIENAEKIPNVLACDCGNSTIALGWVHSETVCDAQSFALGAPAELAQALSKLWAKMPQPKCVAAASVNPSATKALQASVRQATGQDVLVVGQGLPLPIEVSPALANPERIGTDRLCCAVAAYDKLGSACVVADFGSAATIDCVNDEGVFMGGAILPGLAIAAEALGEKTAQLPRVELAQPDGVFGTDTAGAIRLGLIRGMRGSLRELTEAYATELGTWPAVIITGGEAKLICPNPGQNGLVQALVEDLCLRGVAMAYYKSLLQE